MVVVCLSIIVSPFLPHFNSNQTIFSTAINIVLFHLFTVEGKLNLLTLTHTNMEQKKENFCSGRCNHSCEKCSWHPDQLENWINNILFSYLVPSLYRLNILTFWFPRRYLASQRIYLVVKYVFMRWYHDLNGQFTTTETDHKIDLPHITPTNQQHNLVFRQVQMEWIWNYVFASLRMVHSITQTQVWLDQGWGMLLQPN